MNNETRRIVMGIADLIKRPNVDPEISLLAAAVLHLYKQTGQLHADDMEAFDQIEELDRRQGPGDN
jgi:hypothetical protein